MGFYAEVDFLMFGRAGLVVVLPADKTTLSPPKLKRNFDVKPGFGIDGAFCIYTGEGLATFDATFEFWNASKEPIWDAFARNFLGSPSRNPEPSALSIHHPILFKPPFHITGVVATEIEGWSLVTPGHWQTRVSFLEYRAPKKFPPMKTEPAVPAVAGVVPAKPKTEQDLRIIAGKAKLQGAVDAGKK